MDGAIPLEWSHTNWHDADRPHHDIRSRHQFSRAGRTSASPHSRRPVSTLTSQRLNARRAPSRLPFHAPFSPSIRRSCRIALNRPNRDGCYSGFPKVKTILRAFNREKVALQSFQRVSCRLSPSPTPLRADWTGPCECETVNGPLTQPVPTFV
jgi:hypothetical protein